MARSWTEFLGDAEGPYETQEAQRGFMRRLRDSLGRSRRALTEQLAVAAFDPGDEASWERLEEALLQGDVGVTATAELVRRLEQRQELGDLNDALAEEISALFGPPPRSSSRSGPGARRRTSSAGSRAPTRPRSPMTRSRRPGPAATTSRSSTRPAASTRRRASWTSWPRYAA